MSKNLVIIPTYNEIGNIEAIIRAVKQLSREFDILVVDDNSPDGTQKSVDTLIEESKDKGGGLFLIKRGSKQGLGSAYIEGFRFALSKDYQYIFEMDADFSHDPKDLPRLLQACENGADVAVGSRYVKGGKVENWALPRRALSYFASVYARLITGIKVHDTTAGFVCYTRHVLEAIDLSKVNFVGYAFQIEMKYICYKKDFKIAEVPITFKDRQNGQSKLGTEVITEAIFGVFKLRHK